MDEKSASRQLSVKEEEESGWEVVGDAMTSDRDWSEMVRFDRTKRLEISLRWISD